MRLFMAEEKTSVQSGRRICNTGVAPHLIVRFHGSSPSWNGRLARSSPLLSFKEPMNIPSDPRITVLPVHVAWASSGPQAQADIVPESVRTVASPGAKA